MKTSEKTCEKTIVGFAFTDQTSLHLEKVGFTISKSDDTLKLGYREFICHLSQERGLKSSFEIREVLDEELYFANTDKKNFAPFISENSVKPELVNHPNSVHYAQDILYDTMPSNELSHYWSIKKRHPLWAIWLRCDDFTVFEKFASQELKMTWQNQPAYLIHLGLSCFDLLVTK